jgi:hypothetical protein
MAAVGDRAAATGRSGELLLYAYGRTDHARVDLDGPPKDLTAFRAVHLGL